MKRTILSSLFVIVTLFAFLPSANAQKVKSLDNENFKTEIGEGYVLVDFWATWCKPCRMLSPILEELATDFEGRVKFAKLDVDAARNIASEYSIRSLPTLILFKDGKPVEAWIGYKEKEELAQKIGEAIM